MLSIAKLRVGQEAYTLAGVAQSLDDYYTGVGEASGTWLGAGADRLGLTGEVAADDLRSVLAGIAPDSGGLSPNGETIRPHRRRVPGFDLTFKAPKSMSVLYAVSDDPRVQGAIIEAGDTAVAEALGWLEREAIRVRRGTGNEAFLNDLAARDPDAAAAARIRTLRARGLVAAAFRHRTSRAGDPLLHWHTLVANLVEGPDGRWSALVHPELYRAVRAAGEVFQTVLRGELTARLGLQWWSGRHVSEVAGVPQGLCDRFSKRSREINTWLQTTGMPDDPAGRQAAVLATRRSKPEREHERFDAVWKAEALAAGWGPEQAEALITASAEQQIPEWDEVWRLPTVTGVGVVDRVVDPEEWIASLLRELTDRDSTFTRTQLVQAVAARLGEGATMATLERVVARVMASDQVIPVADNQAQMWTSADLLAVERRFLHVAHATRSSRVPIGPACVDTVINRFGSLGVDQADAVRALARSTDAVSVLVGPAGTGKTFTLDAVAAVFETAGYRLVGTAPSGKAADELESGAHITASTMHRLLGSWDRGYDLSDTRTVVVVDEAAMAGVRELEAVVSRTVAAGGRVVLVGDHHQLPEVTAGGGFAALATDPAATVTELRVNRRQHVEWERAALAELRDGHVAKAVAALRDNSRVVVADDRAGTITAGVERWFTAHDNGQVPVLLAGTNDTVNALNRAVRRALLDGGWLGRDVAAFEGTLAVGERLMVRRNDYRAVTTAGERTKVLNGQTATLLDATDTGLVVRMDHSVDDVVLSPEFITGGGVDYAYASTGHRAQGGTWDVAITVGLDGLYREAGYLIMSRGTQSNWLVVTAPELEALDAELARHDSTIPLPSEEPNDLDDALIATFNASRAKLLALTRDPHADAVATAATRYDVATLEAWGAYARQVEQTAARIVGIDPDRAHTRLDRINHTATHVAVGQRVKAADRNNIGTIIGVDDTTGTVDVEFVAVDGRSAERTMSWEQVQIIDRHPDPRHLDDTATATLRRLTQPIRDQLDRWTRLVTQSGVGVNDRHVYEAAAQLAIDRTAAHLAAAQPGWLTDLLGPRPTNPAAVQVWDDTVREIATHRTRHRNLDLDEPIGPDNVDPAARTAWTMVLASVARARIWLDTHIAGPVLPVTRTRSISELQARQAELERLFADAPADWRALIARLRSRETLPFDDTAELLQQALAAQGERRRWILEHWPHVVEHAQITHTLDHDLAGPELPSVIDRLRHSTSPYVAAAADHDERWLITLVGQLAAPDTAVVDAATERLLADVAGYRHRWNVTGPSPLGDVATDIDQANERGVLAIAIDQAAAPLERSAITDLGDDRIGATDKMQLWELDESLGR